MNEAKELLAQRFNVEPQLLTLPQDLEQAYAPLYGLSFKKKISAAQKKKAMKKQLKEHQKGHKPVKVQKERKKKKEKAEVQEEAAND